MSQAPLQDPSPGMTTRQTTSADQRNLAAGERLARRVSDILNPLFVALPTFLVVALHTAPDAAHAILWWAVTTVGITAAPLAFVWRGVRAGKYTDLHLSLREQRIIPIVVGVLCTLAAFVALLALHTSRALLATVVSVIVGGIVTLAITTRWKISLQVTAITGSVTVLALLFGPVALVLTPLVLLVVWARLRLRAHTVPQAIVALAVTVVLTVAVFHLLGAA